MYKSTSIFLCVWVSVIISAFGFSAEQERGEGFPIIAATAFTDSQGRRVVLYGDKHAASEAGEIKATEDLVARIETSNPNDLHLLLEAPTDLEEWSVFFSSFSSQEGVLPVSVWRIAQVFYTLREKQLYTLSGFDNRSHLGAALLLQKQHKSTDREMYHRTLQNFLERELAFLEKFKTKDAYVQEQVNASIVGIKKYLRLNAPFLSRSLLETQTEVLIDCMTNLLQVATNARMLSEIDLLPEGHTLVLVAGTMHTTLARFYLLSQGYTLVHQLDERDSKMGGRIFDLLLSQHPCNHCGKEAQATCETCHYQYYCNTDCQKARLQQHKELCGRMTIPQPVNLSLGL